MLEFKVLSFKVLEAWWKPFFGSYGRAGGSKYTRLVSQIVGFLVFSHQCSTASRPALCSLLDVAALEVVVAVVSGSQVMASSCMLMTGLLTKPSG